MTLSQLTQRVRGTIAGLFSPSKLPNSLAILILVFASTQLGIHFWPDSTLVYGIRVDYLSPTIYFLDVLILTHLVTVRTLLNRNSRLQVEKGSPAGERRVLIEQPHSWTDLIGQSELRSNLLKSLFPILLINLIFSSNPLATLNWSFHFLLYFLFISTLSSAFIKKSLTVILPLTMFFQVTLASFQVFLGHTIQGPLYYLGERAISIGTPNAARAVVFGRTALRAYGTFSHPNILAGWLVLSFLILLHLLCFRQRTLLDRRPGQRPSWDSKAGRRVLFGSTVITSLGILLTQSRSAAIALFGIIIPFYLLKNLRSRLLYSLSLLFIIYYLLFTSAFSRAVDTSLTDRLHLQGVSSQVIRAFPIFGTGASASISTYQNLPLAKPRGVVGLQPDHNSFTLLLSWFGIIGILAILYLLRSHIVHYSLFIIPLVPLLALDHYLLTFPQGLLFFLLYLRVAYY